MDDKLSTQPVKRHSDIMAQLNDPVWLSILPEPEGDGWVEAGNSLQSYVKLLQAVTPGAFQEKNSR
ncbi:MAG: hypothetical protein AAFN12_18330 [Cyanobacteria bacterium J06560_2]